MPLIDNTQLALEAAMRGSLMRQTVLTNNLANADTPGYQREDINFQGQLQSAIQAGTPLSQVSFSASTVQGATSADGNGTSAEQDNADISENGLLYQELTQVATSREQMLLTAMGTQGTA